MTATMRKTIKKKRASSANFPLLAFLVTFFLVFAVVVLAVSNFRIYEKRAALQSHIDEKESELEMLKQKMDQAKAPDGPDDDFMIEKIAREQLLLKRPGEEVVFITFPEAEEIETDNEEEKRSVWWNPLTWIID